MSKWVKNTTLVTKTYAGKDIMAGAYREVDNDDWTKDSLLLTDIGSGAAVMAKDDSGTTDITDVNQAIDFLKGNIAQSVIVTGQAELPPFGSKVLPDGKKLFTRVWGMAFPLDGTTNVQSATFTVPYAAAKITETEIVGATLGDAIDFTILDTITGAYQQSLGIPAESVEPSKALNQFGFSVYPSEGRYSRKSDYDADLSYGLQIETRITPITTGVRTVYVNLVLHEVV